MKDEAKVTIIIPMALLERFDMFVKTIDSIQAGLYKNIHIVVVSDGNLKLYEAIKIRNEWLKLRNLTVIMNKERKDWVFSINRVLKEFDSDYYIFGSDDIIFPSDCIKCAMARMQECFPDGFGVVSIGKKDKTTFGLFGRKFAEHFPDRQVFCPDYIHYAGDSELFRTVRKLGIYAFPPKRDSSVQHARLKDGTWRLARAVRDRDHVIRNERWEKGYSWGVDFNLIAEKR